MAARSARVERPRGRTAVLAVLGTVLAVLATAGPAWAHFDPAPAEVPAGQRVTVEFNLEHGCDGSPTIKVSMQVPPAAADPVPGEVPGFTARLDGGVAVWEGGPLSATTEQVFPLEFTAPAAAVKLEFPSVQTCEQGENAWIEKQAQGQPEPEFPVPAVQVVGSATTTTAAAATTATSAATSTSTTTTAVPVSTSSDDSNTTRVVVGILALAVVAIGALGYFLVRKRKQREEDETAAL